MRFKIREGFKITSLLHNSNLAKVIYRHQIPIHKKINN